MLGSTSFVKKGKAGIDPTALADLSPVSESDEIYVPKKSGGSKKSRGSENNAGQQGKKAKDNAKNEKGESQAKDASAS